jgi:hypothetical protein
MTRITIAVVLALAHAPALAQQSASHRLEEHAFNAGGHPAAGIGPTSASHRLTLGSLGESIAPWTLLGASTGLAGGFVAAYPPPGEVTDLVFPDKTTLVWNPEPSAGGYNLYRASLDTLDDLTYGACAQQGVASATTTDTTPVAAGNGVFFLVTVENRLGEEGTKGFRAGGVERTGTVCP